MYWGIHGVFVYKFIGEIEYNVKLKYRTPYRKSNYIFFNKSFSYIFYNFFKKPLRQIQD